MKGKSTTRSCEIVSRLVDDSEKVLFDMDNLEENLKRDCIQYYSYIIHDQDTYSAEEEQACPEHTEGDLKPAHIHLLLKFFSPQHYENIAKWFGVPTNFVNKIRSRWKNAVVYQIHRNAPEKYQYSIEEITANFDVQSMIDSFNEEQYLDETLEKILDGTIREYNKTREIDNMILVRYSRQINEAFKVRAEHLQATIKERNMECIFITGASGSGKSTLARKIAETRGLDYFISGGSNDALDGYGMQPCIILDDIRPSAMGLSDFLKMLDPHLASSVKSRYKNKYINCELMILTTVMSLDTFYGNVFSEEKEPIMQLKRRCRIYISMDIETIYISEWDDLLMKYTNPVAYKNTLLNQLLPKEKKSKQDVRQHVTELMPFLELEEDEVIDTDPFHLEKIHTTQQISDKNYQQLMPGKNKDLTPEKPNSI